jgi:DNA repair exonuclease SbcCD nuclease subunit
MRALAFSDVHLDHVTEGLARFNDIAEAMSQVTDHAIREKVDSVFFLGDLCDPDKNLSVVRCIYMLQEIALRLKRHQIRTHFLPGNHDVIEDGSGATTLFPMRALQSDDPWIQVHEHPGYYTDFKGFDILALPFTPLSHTYDPVEVVRDLHRHRRHPEYPLIILSHLVVEGIQPGEETTEMPRGRDIILPHRLIAELFPRALVLQGHYHRRQKFENVNVVGSLVNLTFGEESHHPGYVMVEI